MLLERIKNIRHEFNREFPLVNNSSDLENLRIKYLSRNGMVSSLFDEMKNVPREEKPIVGKELNTLREEITAEFNRLREKFNKQEEITNISIDPSLPEDPIIYGLSLIHI